VAVLLLLNGAPGVGKSSLADLLVRHRPMMLALDVDRIKHALGRWDDDAELTGRHARRLAVAMIREHLAAGYDVAVAQYLSRPDFIEELETIAHDAGAQFRELVLTVDAPTLAERLRHRQFRPDRLEHAVNNTLVGPADAARLVRSLEAIRLSRPRCTPVDASGSLAATLALVTEVLDRG
jgi:predicted ABC-type ATPase